MQTKGLSSQLIINQTSTTISELDLIVICSSKCLVHYINKLDLMSLEEEIDKLVRHSANQAYHWQSSL